MMKHSLTLLLLTLFLLPAGSGVLSAAGLPAAAGAVSALPSATPVLKAPKEVVTVVFSVPGMHCKKCVRKVEDNIGFEKGVTDLKIDLKNRRVTVIFEKGKTDTEKLLDAFRKIGYSAAVESGETSR